MVNENGNAIYNNNYRTSNHFTSNIKATKKDANLDFNKLVEATRRKR